MIRSGDIITARVQGFPLLLHYGIAAENFGRLVILHNTPGRGTVMDPAETFFNSRQLVQVNGSWLNNLSETEIFLRFEACKGEFNLLYYNCEHFIDAMLNENKRSEQLNRVIYVGIFLSIIYLIFKLKF